MYKLIMAFWLVVLAQSLSAQYNGGQGDGTDHRTTTQLSLDGVPGGIRPLYLGGSGDGYAERTTSAALNGQSTAAFFGGGSGDGYAHNQASVSLAGTDLAQLYFGGNGDGYANLQNSLSLNGTSLAGLYGGGPGDGYDKAQFSAALNGQTLTGIYSGGPGDGYASLAFQENTLSGVGLARLYGGGAGDGYDHSQLSATLNGFDLRGLYGGGVGDGQDYATFEGVVPLPLTLLSFDAFPEEEYVLLRWVTEDEVGTDFFTIERTRSGREFEFVGETPAAGYSEPGEQIVYELRDPQPLDGTSYYRLTTTDFDGFISRSHLVDVAYQRDQPNDWNFQLFPNPNTGRHFTVRLDGNATSELTEVEVLDAQGRVLLKESFPAGEATDHRFDLQNRLPSGSYLIRVSSAGRGVQSKILVVGK